VSSGEDVVRFHPAVGFGGAGGAGPEVDVCVEDWMGGHIVWILCVCDKMVRNDFVDMAFDSWRRGFEVLCILRSGGGVRWCGEVGTEK
jgi:hypothetical protein